MQIKLLVCIKLDNLCVVTDDIESYVVKVKLNNRTIVTVIIGIYRPPNGNVESFTNILLLILNDPNLEKSEVIVTGDIN